MYKGPPAPPKEEESGKDRVLDTLRNEPVLITGIISGVVTLLVGLGYFSEGVAGVVISILTTVVILLLSFIGRNHAVGPLTHERAAKKEHKP